MTDTIVVVRHGETDWNFAGRIQGRTEVPLNSTGRAQALESAHLLRDAGPWINVISSPLGRAIETAQIIADALGLQPPSLDESLLERDFGPSEGVIVEEAKKRWSGLHVPGAETLDGLATRGSRAFTRLLLERPGSIVVAHGALIRSALTEMSGIETPRILNGEAWEITPAIDGAGRPSVASIGAPSLQHAY